MPASVQTTECLTGKPFSGQTDRPEDSRFSWTVVALTLSREKLYDRINRRAEGMVHAGLKEEVRRLLNAGVPEDAQSMSGIGYRQMIPLIRGEGTEEDVIREIQKASRHYAKRQMTFLRREETVSWVDTDTPDLYESVKERMRINPWTRLKT